MTMAFQGLHIRFLTGSQDLYGEAILAQVKEQSAAAGASSTSCSDQGASVCRTGTVFRCEQGTWNSTFRPC